MTTPSKDGHFSPSRRKRARSTGRTGAAAAASARERERLARPLLAAALALFYCGCAFAYFLVLPAAFCFLTVVTPPDITSMVMLAIPMCLLYELGILAVRWLLLKPAG